MTKIVRDLPAVVTCYAYRPEYVAEMEGMLATIREHHPDWLVVVGRGPVPGFDLPTFEVESPSGKHHWSLPVPIEIDGSENDFLRICYIKAWWIAEVWRNFGGVAGERRNRLVWTDADARFNGPLDVELDPEAEVVAGPWWSEPEMSEFEHICGGLLVFQGGKNGVVERIINEWSSKCLEYIQDLPPQTKPWPDDDQIVLTDALKHFAESESGFRLLKMEMERYIRLPTDGGKEIVGRSLIDHWYMSSKMRLPEYRDRDWPPPEEYRRRAAVGTPIPNVNWKDGESPDEAG